MGSLLSGARLTFFSEREDRTGVSKPSRKPLSSGERLLNEANSMVSSLRLLMRMARSASRPRKGECDQGGGPPPVIPHENFSTFGAN